MSFDRFCDHVRRAFASKRSVVPVWRDLLLDTDTPVSAFAKLRRGPFAFLLESAPAGSETWSRYTFLGTEPASAWRWQDGVAETWHAGRGWHGARTIGDPVGDLQALVRARRPLSVPELGAFWTGAVGYFSYDIARTIEHLPQAPPRAVRAPDALFCVTRVVVILDNLRGQARVVAAVPVDDGMPNEALRHAYESAMRDVEAVIGRLREPSPLPSLVLDEAAPPAVGSTSYARDRFLHDVERIREYVHAGDCFQTLLARRIAVPHDFDSASLYRALRALNPSPYMYHLALDGVELVGCSPELLVRVADGRVVVRPIAGTRPRGATEADDERLGADLLSDEKERAEHLMLVDLGRNDVGRVAEYGSVRATELMAVERYSHVLHLVSEVEGRIRSDLSALDVFRATFPAGTMTGAPKVRAMEIIDELEPERRGPYAGAVGYVSTGDERMDLAITIRTCVIADGVASIQAGAGIVADSVPEREWEETENKARAMLLALGRVRQAAASPSTPAAAPAGPSGAPR